MAMIFPLTGNQLIDFLIRFIALSVFMSIVVMSLYYFAKAIDHFFFTKD